MYNTKNRVKRGTKRIDGGFSKGYYALRVDQLEDFREEMKAAAGWSHSKMYNRMRGLFPFRDVEIPIVDRIFSYYGLNAWTGESIPIIPRKNEKKS